jgi:primosomal protein N' (replication factor Y)
VGGRKVSYAQPTDALEAPGSLRGQAAAILALLRASGEQPVARLEDRFRQRARRGEEARRPRPRQT